MSRELQWIDPAMTGDDVRNLQARLIALGYMSGAPDGEFGPITARAVRAFQRDRGLRDDGVVDPTTAAALDSGSRRPAVAAPRPCTATEAVARALSLVGRGGQYQLGTGDYHPARAGTPDDLPWAPAVSGAPGSDCAGFALSWCYKLPRHRPGLNVGPWATVSDDINCNSAIEDADHAQDLFVRATGAVQPGDLLTYPTITLPNHPKPWIGHVAIVTGVGRAAAFDLANPDYSLLDVAQCCGPNGRAPAVIASDGSIWNQHDHQWPLPAHRTVVLRAKP
jgi:Putative peptidoglycan binding domain/CHAP domain